MPPSNEFYSEEDVQTILRLASQSGAQAGLSRDQLLQMAQEIGLSQEAVARAESQLAKVKEEAAAKAEEAESRIEYRSQVMGSFRGHAISYVAVNLGLVMTWLATTNPPNHDFWPIYPMLGWGFGLIGHLTSVFNKGAFEEGFRQWQKEKNLVGLGSRLLKQPNSSLEGSPIDEFMLHLSQSGVRNRLEAIKLYRQATGSSLTTAKQVIDDYAVRNPNMFR